MHFAKGHGTENDFVLLPDLDGRLDLTPALVRALCDRRAGIGADGVLRVVRTAQAPSDAPSGDVEWFMDYRNADGSTAEMCGNGIRVFARYLVDAGLAAPGRLPLATRHGIREVRLGPVGEVTVDMGPAELLGVAAARIGGRSYDGSRVDIGNPHLVCPVEGPLAAYDLGEPPDVDATVFPAGVNVEIVTTVGERHVAMRVHERGVGETRSCGTGACAVAVAMAGRSGAAPGDDDGPGGIGAPGRGGAWTVDVPGGRLTVELTTDTVRLTGPAVIVGTGELDGRWLAAAGS